jgi:hypothetical protein
VRGGRVVEDLRDQREVEVRLAAEAAARHVRVDRGPRLPENRYWNEAFRSATV